MYVSGHLSKFLFGALISSVVATVLIPEAREAVWGAILELIIIGKLPFIDVRVNFFASSMIVLVIVAALSLMIRDYYVELFTFKTVRRKEQIAAQIIKPTIDVDIEEVVEELEASTA